MKYFGNDFMWGSATSSHQVEGGNHNDWTEWEKENASRLAKEAVLKNWPDYILNDFPGPLRRDNYISGVACDHYNRFEEDFDIAKSLGHNAHRFSIEWSRIEPEEGKFSQREIEHYRSVIKALKARGIEPFVTLWHWTNPIWVRDQGGWENRKTIKDFHRYVEKILDSFRDLEVVYWMPINEPGTYVGKSFIEGTFPPNVRNLFKANIVFRNLMNAYRDVYCLIHEKVSGANVGMSHYAVNMIPYKNYFWNIFLVKILDYIRNWRFLDSINETNDFIGIQFYHTDIINLKLSGGRWGPIDTKNNILTDWVSDIGWQVYPDSLLYLLRRAAKYNKPIYITENGIADSRDEHRNHYIKAHLKRVSDAIKEGVDIRGYFYWSLLDNFEWDKGFWPRFGLVEIDYKTMERKVRPSAGAYKRIIAEGL